MGSSYVIAEKEYNECMLKFMSISYGLTPNADCISKYR